MAEVQKQREEGKSEIKINNEGEREREDNISKLK